MASALSVERCYDRLRSGRAWLPRREMDAVQKLVLFLHSIHFSTFHECSIPNKLKGDAELDASVTITVQSRTRGQSCCRRAGRG